MIRTKRCRIEPIDRSHLDSVIEVYRECEDFLALGPQPKASLEMVLSDVELSRTEYGTYCGIWDSADVMIGIVDYVAGGFEGTTETGFLSLLMIAVSRRGSGFGAEVVSAIEHVLAEEFGVTTVLSAVQVNNEPAIRFWARMGYQTASGPEPQLDGTVTYRLKKDISRG